jgi:hypothetical protein
MMIMALRVTPAEAVVKYKGVPYPEIVMISQKVSPATECQA